MPLEPKSNQQGESMRRYCADVVGLLDDASILLLEVKVHDFEAHNLPVFRQSQHEEYLRFEALGVPVGYAYNAIEDTDLACYAPMPQPLDAHIRTLRQINRSVPSELPNQHPNLQAHRTLLDWLMSDRGGAALETFGRALGTIRIEDPEQLRNGLLVLIYGVSRQSVAMMSADQADMVYRWLVNESTLSTRRHASLQRILGAADDVFDRFTRPARPSHRPRPRP